MQTGTYLEEWDLSARAFNRLKMAGMSTQGDLFFQLEMGIEHCMKTFNLGYADIKEILCEAQEKGYLAYKLVVWFIDDLQELYMPDDAPDDQIAEWEKLKTELYAKILKQRSGNTSEQSDYQENIFEYCYTTNMYPARLKPLSKKELSRGMSENATEEYLRLVEHLYNASWFDVNAEFAPLSNEESDKKYCSQSMARDAVITHLLLQNAIDHNTFDELLKFMPEFNTERHPSKPNQFVSDSLDDFRLAFEWSVIENNYEINLTNEYLCDRYDCRMCLSSATKELALYSFKGLQPVELSYWEVKKLLDKIRADIKRNQDDQQRLDEKLSKSSHYYSNYLISAKKETYAAPKNVGEWYTIKRALETDANRLLELEFEVDHIFKNTPRPTGIAGCDRTLYVYKGYICCHRQNHNTVPATAIMYDALDREVELDVEHCPTCNRYLLNYTSYKNYRDRHSILIGNVRMITTDSYGMEMELAMESPLKLCGYNVSQAEGLSTATRQYLLAKIIHEGIMTKLDVIHHLEYFINVNGARSGMQRAVSKWCEDLDFVHGYKKDIQPTVYISDVKKY